MKQIFVFMLVIPVVLSTKAQQAFFKSSQSIPQHELNPFYASVAIQDNLLLFNAPDYHLYAYDKTTGLLKWDYNLHYKSNIHPFFVQGSLWATSNEKLVQLDTATGKLQKTINLYTLETTPFIKDGILYGTGIYDGGCLYAYDLEADSLLWKKFLAHGCSRQPYYLANKIIANREGDNWLEINYNGSFVDAACASGNPEEGDVFPSQLACVKNFTALTHDGKAINGKLSKKMDVGVYSNPDIMTGSNNTFVLNEGTLYVLGDKLKLKQRIPLHALSDSIVFSDSETEKIVKATEENLWILYGDHLLVYNFKKKKLERVINLEEWQPHQAIVEDNRLWLISGKDGLLYGLTVD